MSETSFRGPPLSRGAAVDVSGFSGGQENVRNTRRRALNACRLISVCLSTGGRLNLPSRKEGKSTRGERINKPLASSLILSEEASVESLPVLNPEPHPSGSGFRFSESNLVPRRIVRLCRANRTFFGVHFVFLRLSGDDTKSAYREKKVSCVQRGAGTRNEHRTGRRL